MRSVEETHKFLIGGVCVKSAKKEIFLVHT